jgi:Predicted nucleoside-diphosphate-sugar epimerase
MNVLWIKDNNIGHEKQVKVLLDELLKNHNFDIEERSVKGSLPFCRHINKVNKNYYDIIIGAGHKTYPFLLNLKKNQKKLTKIIAILTPTFKKSNFDIICAPFHDKSKFNNLSNVIFFEGSLAKVSQNEPDQDIIMVALGGKNKHYEFKDNHILSQIEYFLSLHPNKKCYIFNSRRTPTSMNKKIESLVNKNRDAIFCHFRNHR